VGGTVFPEENRQGSEGEKAGGQKSLFGFNLFRPLLSLQPGRNVIKTKSDIALVQLFSPRTSL
jgi:hypothetical protein